MSLVGLLIAVHVVAAAARSTARRVDAVDEVPNFMKNARPAQTRRRLDACLGQTACSADGSPCASGEFCNFDDGSSGSCEQCSSHSESTDCYNDGLPSDGAFDCHACCFDGNVTRFPTYEPTTAAPSTQSPTGTPTTAAPSMTFAPTPTPPYEYAPTVDAMPYCRLQSSSVCWGNTHRFLKVTANGPFDSIDIGDGIGYSAPAVADFDGDGTLRPRPSIDKLRSHVLCLSQATWTSSWAILLARSSTPRTPGRLRRRRSW